MGNYYLKKITLDDEMNRRGQTLAIDLAGWIVQVDKIYLLKYTYFFNYDIIRVVWGGDGFKTSWEDLLFSLDMMVNINSTALLLIERKNISSDFVLLGLVILILFYDVGQMSWSM